MNIIINRNTTKKQIQHTELYNYLLDFLQFDDECTCCIKMGWKKDCPFENIPEVKQMDYKEEDKFYEKHFDELDGKCKKYLRNKLSTNIKIENKKIETTEEGDKFFSALFTNLENCEVR